MPKTSKVDWLKRVLAETPKFRKESLELAKRQAVAAEELLRVAKDDSEVLKKLHWEVNFIRRVQENIRMATIAPIRADLRRVVQNKQLSFLDTLAKIKDEGLSYARFGDGEFRMICRIDHNLRFHKNSFELQAALSDALSNPAPNVLVGMPNVFLDLHWSTVYAEVWHDIRPLVENAEEFGNSHVTRPIAFQVHGSELVEAWRSVWEDKNAVVVTGKGSRFDMNPALFSSLKSHEFVYSEPSDAFYDVPRVLRELIASSPEIVLISLGPAGSILANELARAGIQALDIGHLSASYENIIEGGTFPEHRPVKK